MIKNRKKVLFCYIETNEHVGIFCQTSLFYILKILLNTVPLLFYISPHKFFANATFKDYIILYLADIPLFVQLQTVFSFSRHIFRWFLFSFVYVVLQLELLGQKNGNLFKVLEACYQIISQNSAVICISQCIENSH